MYFFQDQILSLRGRNLTYEEKANLLRYLLCYWLNSTGGDHYESQRNKAEIIRILQKSCIEEDTDFVAEVLDKAKSTSKSKHKSKA